MARKAPAAKNKKKTDVLKKKVLQTHKVLKAVKKVKAMKPGSKKAVTKSKLAAKVKKKVLPIPAGYHTVTPYLFLSHAEKGIEFYKVAFGAKELCRLSLLNGKISHAELKIGDSRIMLSDESAEMQAFSPSHLGGSPVVIHLYVKKVDVVIEKAVAAGAKLIRPVEDLYYGDRSGMVEDPFGHKWCVSTHIEDVTPAKVRKRAADFEKKTS